MREGGRLEVLNVFNGNWSEGGQTGSEQGQPTKRVSNQIHIFVCPIRMGGLYIEPFIAADSKMATENATLEGA